MTIHRTFVAVLVGATFLAGGAIAASKLPNLPKDLTLPQDEESPGAVVFRHKTHVKAKDADCTVCHPSMWPIRPGGTKPKVTHKAMKKGEYCGKCHDGEKAFGLDECDSCHTSEE